MGLFDWLRKPPRKTAKEWLDEARTHTAQGRHAEAVRAYGHIPRREQTAAILVEAAQACLAAGLPGHALDQAVAALALDPRHAPALCVQGEVLLREKRKSDALARFREALQLDPACEWAQRLLAELSPNRPAPPTAAEDALRAQLRQMSDNAMSMLDRGRLPDAVSLAQQAVQNARSRFPAADPDLGFCVNVLGLVRRASGDLDEAESLFREALTILGATYGENDPRYATSLNNLATVLHVRGDIQQVEPLYRQALKVLRTANEPQVLGMTLNNLACLLGERGELDEADSLHREALQFREVLLGEGHPDVAQSLAGLATVQFQRGDLREAERLFRRALEIRRGTLGPEHPLSIQVVSSLARVCDRLGQYAEAAMLFAEALDVYRRHAGPTHPATVQHLNALAEMYRVLGRLNEAEPLYLEALEVRRQLSGGDDADAGNLHGNLGMLYLGMGDFARAEQSLRQALEIHRRALGAEHELVAESMTNLAIYYREIGDLARAESLYHSGLDLRRRLLGEKHPAILQSLNNLGTLYLDWGDFRRAEAHLRDALDRQSQPPLSDHPNRAATLDNLGALYLALGDVARAEEMFREGLTLRRSALGDAAPDVAVSLNNLSSVCARKGDTAAAIACLQQVVAIHNQAHATDHPALAICLDNMGEMQRSAGSWEQAESHLQRGLEMRERLFGRTHPATANSLANLSALHADRGDLVRADAMGSEARDILRSTLGEDHPRVAVALANLAVYRAAAGRAADALALVKQAAAIHDRTIGQMFALGSESQRLGFLSEVRGLVNCLLSLACGPLCDSPEAIGAAFDLVLRRKGLAAEALAVQRDAVLGGRHPELKARLAEAASLRMWIAQKTLAGPGPEGGEAHRRQLDDWAKQREQLEAELARQVPDLALDEKLRSANCQAVAAALPAESVLVEFIRFDDRAFAAVAARGEPAWRPARYLAFVLHAGQPDGVRLIDLGEAERLDRLVAECRAALTGDSSQRALTPGRSSPPAASDGSTRLRRALFDPLLPALAGRTRLLLAPDGELCRLPFEVLLLDDGRCLIDTCRISYVATGRDLLRFGRTQGRVPKAPVIAADPDFDLRGTPAREAPRSRVSRVLERSQPAERLPGTRLEAERIASLLGVKPLLGADALEGRLKQVQSPRILHLATHGFFLQDQRRGVASGSRELAGAAPTDRLSSLPENPLLRSGLLLAGFNVWRAGRTPPAEAEDGMLTAEDVSGLDLLDTQLVVLSACQTGLGDVRAGEGVFGLRRAFVLAGAQTLVMSLWNVPDEQTQEIMVEFYRRMLAGEPRAEALRQAQLAVKARHPEPFFWAGFICQGDAGPLP